MEKTRAFLAVTAPLHQPAAGDRACATLPDAITEIDGVIAAQDWTAAGDRIAEARERWPGDLRLKLLEAGWLEGTGRPDDARARLLSARSEHPDNPWPPVRLVELALRTRDAESARTVFADAVWDGAAPERTRTGLLSRTTATLADPAARRAFLESLLHDTPDDRFVLMKLATLSFRERDRARTEELFAAARALGPLTDESRQIELELHFAASRFEEAYALARELQARNPTRVEFARRAIQAAIFSHRADVMVELLGTALERWPTDWLLLFRYNRCPLPKAVDCRLFAALSERAGVMAKDERWLFQFAIACLRHNRTDEAVAIIERLTPDGPVGKMAVPLAATLASQPAAVWSNPRGISNACDDDVQVVASPGAVATVVLFSSVVGGLGYLPFGHADGLLRQRPVNTVYLRDLNHRSFTSGVRSLGSDHADMLGGLQRIAADLGAPVITMGSSIAGVAAIRAATMMGAKAAISFAGPVNLGVDAADDAPPPTMSATDGTRANLFSAFTETERGVVDLARSAPETTIHQCYGADFAPDVEAAGLLAGLANARLHAVPGCADHFAIEHMITNGSFFTVLDTAIADRPEAV